MKDNGFILRINNSTDNPSPWKILFFYSIRFNVKDTFCPLCMFVAHYFVSGSIAVTIKGGSLASFNDSINHSWGAESNASR